MKDHVDNFQISLKIIFFKWKKSILGFFILIGFFAFLMAKFYPKQPYLGKEYNYLYSLQESMKNGSKTSLEKIEKKLESFKNIKPLFDGFFISNYLQQSNFDKAFSVLNGIKSRLIIKNDKIEEFTLASIEIQQGDFERAYQRSLKLLDKDSLSQNYKVLYGYNLYRIFLLEEILEYKDKAIATIQKLESFLEKTKNVEKQNSGVLSALHAHLNKKNHRDIDDF